MGSVPEASVVVPAHNEEPIIARLLSRLEPANSGLEFIVVCNGCTDSTVAKARAFGDSIQVIDLAESSKQLALATGSRVASVFPRIFIDADVEIDRASVIALAKACQPGTGVLAAGPQRVIPKKGVSSLVAGYYAIWERLPAVQSGLFGRGVIALSHEGFKRVAALPPVLSDDLAFSEAFDYGERLVLDSATVVVYPPKNLADLLRRRIRAVTGIAQADKEGTRTEAAATRVSDLLRIVKSDPRLAFALPVFLTVTAISRFRARSALRNADYSTWERDESSRAR